MISSFAGTVYRHIPVGKFLYDLRALRLADGRWNRYDKYGCIYTALEEKTAVAEWEKMLAQSPFPDNKTRDLVKFEVSVPDVLDLTSAKMRRIFDTTLAKILSDTPGDIEGCRMLADQARLSGFKAILAPSAAIEDGRTLTLYTDRPPLSEVRLSDHSLIRHLKPR